MPQMRLQCDVRNWSAKAALIGVVLCGCASNHDRAGVASRTYDCYEWYPYVYSAPADCWYGRSAWYDPAYYYYRPYPDYVASMPSAFAPGSKAARSRLLAPRERPLADPGPELPLPIPHPPRVLP